jgi:hypothetical protein
LILEQIKIAADISKSEEVKQLQMQIKSLHTKPAPVKKPAVDTTESSDLLFEEIQVLRNHVGHSVEAHLKAAKLLEFETALLCKER